MSQLTREDITKYGFADVVADLMLRQIDVSESILDPSRKSLFHPKLRLGQEISELLCGKFAPPRDTARWAVRICTHWHTMPFKFRTFGVVPTKEAGEFLRAFTGRYIHTEVSLVEVGPGADPLANYISDWERYHSYGPSRPALPARRRPRP